MNKLQFKNIINKYDGDVKETSDIIEISHSVGTENYTIGLRENGSIYGEQRTGKSLHAGFGTPQPSEDDLLRKLNYYKFQLKKQEQISIFDL